MRHVLSRAYISMVICLMEIEMDNELYLWDELCHVLSGGVRCKQKKILPVL